MRTSVRAGLTSGLLLISLLAAWTAGAQTVLLVVREDAGSRPLPPPFAVREGVSAGLFDAGYVVLDAPDAAGLFGAPDALRVAKSAGADLVLEVSTAYADTSLGVDLIRISARTSYTLIDPATSGVLARGTKEATNRDRELDVDRRVLGAEIGKTVALEVKKALAARSGS